MATPALGAGAAAFDELERAVRHFGEELAFFRRRALEAERRVRDLTTQAAAAAGDERPGAPDLRSRVAELEAENADLRERLRDAAERTRALADRVRFVRQQAVDVAEEPA